MRRGAAFAIGAGLVALAFVITFTEPDDDALEQPFPVRGDVGQQLVASKFATTLTQARLAGEVDADDWIGTTPGVWLVLDVSGEATIAPLGLDAELTVSGVDYDATTRYGEQTTDSVIAVGFPLVGSVLIELPADILDDAGARSAVLRLTPGFDARLDSVTEVVLDLTSLERLDRVEVEPAREAAP